MIILTEIFTDHLRFNYPTYIFNDLSFEIDEDRGSVLDLPGEEV